MSVNDLFELYDLRVEVVIPENGPVYCGAKPATISSFAARCCICRRDRAFPSIR